MKTVRAEAPRVMAEPDNYDARANVMWAGMLCHQGLAGVGRHEDWATHGLEHEVGSANLAHHQLRTARVWRSRSCLDGVRMMRLSVRFADDGRVQLGFTGYVEADALLAIYETPSSSASLGMPTTLEELDADEETPRSTPSPCSRRTRARQPFGSFKKLAMDDAREICRIAL